MTLNYKFHRNEMKIWYVLPGIGRQALQANGTTTVRLVSVGIFSAVAKGDINQTLQRKMYFCLCGRKIYSNYVRVWFWGAKLIFRHLTAALFLYFFWIIFSLQISVLWNTFVRCSSNTIIAERFTTPMSSFPVWSKGSAEFRETSVWLENYCQLELIKDIFSM